MHQNPPLNSLLYANSISVVCCQNQKNEDLTKQTNKQCLIYILFLYKSYVCCVLSKSKKEDMTKQTNTQCLIDFYFFPPTSTRSLINNLLLSPVVTIL